MPLRQRMDPLNDLTPETVLNLGTVSFPLTELYRHLGIFGSTGGGKTWHAIVPLLDQLLGLHSREPKIRPGFCVLDLKGDMVAHVQALAAKYGREDDVVVLGSGGTTWVDPFVDIADNSRAIADRVMQFGASEKGSSRGVNDLFWTLNERRLLTHAATLARARGYGLLEGLDALTQAIRDISDVGRTVEDSEPDKAALDKLLSIVALAERHFFVEARDCLEAAQYFQREVAAMPARTWTCILSSTLGSISTVADGPLSALLGLNGKQGDCLSMAEVVDHGKILVISLPPAHYGPSARALRDLLKASFQKAVLQRKNLVFWSALQERPVNQSRPLFFVADEFQALLTPGGGETGDAYFLDRCREFRCGCIVAAQGMSALQSVMANAAECDHLLNNLGTKVVFSCECIATVNYFESAVGRTLTSLRSRTVQRGLPPPLFRVPVLQRRAGYETALQSESETEEWHPRHRGEELRTLSVGEAFVLRRGGAISRTYLPAIATSPATNPKQTEP